VTKQFIRIHSPPPRSNRGLYRSAINASSTSRARLPLGDSCQRAFRQYLINIISARITRSRMMPTLIHPTFSNLISPILPIGDTIRGRPVCSPLNDPPIEARPGHLLSIESGCSHLRCRVLSVKTAHAGWLTNGRLFVFVIKIKLTEATTIVDG